MPDDNHVTGEDATAGLRQFIAEGRHLDFINEQPARSSAETQPDRLVPASYYRDKVLELLRSGSDDGDWRDDHDGSVEGQVYTRDADGNMPL